jgi:hypothetical protein
LVSRTVRVLRGLASRLDLRGRSRWVRRGAPPYLSHLDRRRTIHRDGRHRREDRLQPPPPQPAAAAEQQREADDDPAGLDLRREVDLGRPAVGAEDPRVADDPAPAEPRAELLGRTRASPS